MHVITAHCETHGDLVSQEYEDHENHAKSGLCFGVAQSHTTAHPDCTVTFKRSTVKAHAARIAKAAADEFARAQEGAEYARKNMLGSAARWKHQQRSTRDRRN